ncbi:Transcription regulator [Lachnospiraceae bacterium TWA4]|nr:Transcription regulator [Lachnospiraceae bacterium TWA4]
MYYYFIINPLASSGRAAVIWRDLKRYLEKHQIEYESFMTSRPHHAVQIAHKLTSGEEKLKKKVIVVIGGDGTLNEVVNGIAISALVTLGYIPAGSGNDFAKSMNISRRPKKALIRILSEEQVELIDYGMLSYMGTVLKQRRFLVSSGIGFDAAVCEEVSYSRIRVLLNRIHLGKISYMETGLRNAITRKTFNGVLELDDTHKIPLKRVQLLSIHNQPYEGGGFKFAPEAECNDGLLDICVISGKSRLRFISLLFSAFRGKHIHKRGVRHYQCNEFSIKLDRPMIVHADGEICEYLHEINYMCEHKKIRMIV